MYKLSVKSHQGVLAAIGIVRSCQIEIEGYKDKHGEFFADAVADGKIVRLLDYMQKQMMEIDNGETEQEKTND